MACAFIRLGVIVSGMLVLATSQLACSKGKNPPQVQKQTMQAMFKLVENDSTSTPAGTQAKFAFSNGTPRTVKMTGYFGQPPKNGMFQPSFVKYEVRKESGWHALDVAYDGIAEKYPIKPGEQLTLLISLGPFEKAGVPPDAQVRVVIGELASDAFQLHQVTGDHSSSKRHTNPVIQAGKDCEYE
jgi:hypothetical protein